MAKKKQTQRGRSSGRTQSRTSSRTSSSPKSGTRKPAQRAGSARTGTEHERTESGQPGGGQGRRDAVGGSKVYPASGGQAPSDSELRNMASWGQKDPNANGYFESGGSELVQHGDQLLGGLDVGPNGAPTADLPAEDDESPAVRPSNTEQQR